MSELGPQGTERSQARQKEADRSDLDEGFRAFRQALIIASQALEADQPAKGAFDLPSVTLDLKATFGLRELDGFAIDEHPLLVGIGVGFGHNLGLPTQLLLDPIDQGSGIATIGLRDGTGVENGRQGPARARALPDDQLDRPNGP